MTRRNPTSPVRLVSLDFDGTILSYDHPDGVFHSAIIELLNELEQAGVMWCANSGRDKPDQLAVITRSVERGLRHLPAALVCMETVVFVRNQSAYESLEDWNAQARHRMKTCHARVHDRLKAKMDYITRKYNPKLSAIGEWYTAFLLHEKDGAAPVSLHEDLERFLDECDDVMLSRNGGWVAVNHRELGKGNALLAFARHAGVSRDQILAVGDHHNDLPMLLPEVAGYLGCPADAIPEVRKAIREAGGMIAKNPGPAGTAEIIRALVF